MLFRSRESSIHTRYSSHPFLSFFLLFNYHSTAPGRAAFVLYSGREGTARVFASLLEEQSVCILWSTLAQSIFWD